MTTRWRRIVPSTVRHLLLKKASIDMGAGWVCSCLLIVLASRGVNSLNPDAGPWVQPTHGEPWPMPNHRHVTDKFYLLRASTFQFNVSNWRERSRGKDSIYIRASLRIIDVSVFLPRERERERASHLELISFLTWRERTCANSPISFIIAFFSKRITFFLKRARGSPEIIYSIIIRAIIISGEII